MPTPIKTRKPQGTEKSMRWFLLMNIVICISLVCGAVFLKKGADRYKLRAQYDRIYIISVKAEQDPQSLLNGLVYTENARATAYKSILNLSHGTSIIWLIIATAFAANTAYLIRINLERKKLLAVAKAKTTS
ncbi:MAG TPA: hypothetical protein DHV60_04055 [Verrucomicrobiales bacterium]|jgi:uncharacterized membrane protein|nr:hypothetical protein [Verrucomicrobiales bacterium]